MNNVVFLTGATGFVGGNLALRILTGDPESRLIVLVRGASVEEGRRRVSAMLAGIDPNINPARFLSRIRVVCGDITRSDFGLYQKEFQELADEVTHIVHSAATVQFQLPLKQALAVNTLGTRNVLTFARLAARQGRLQKMGHIGTAYVVGNRVGTIYEDELEHRSGFANTYEHSKYEAEMIVRDHVGLIPLVIFRPSIIVGDSRTGVTSSFNTLYTPLRYIFRGILRALPCPPTTPLDVVPVDFVRDAIYHIMVKTNVAQGETFHLTSAAQSTTVGEVVTSAVRYFNELVGTDRVAPVAFLPDQGAVSSEESLRFKSKAVEQLYKTYAPYLCLHRVFDNTNVLNTLKGTSIDPPRYDQYYRTILRYFIRTFWGRELKQAA